LSIDETGTIQNGSVDKQTAQCITNISHILTAGDSSLERVVKVTVFLTDMANFTEMNAVYEKYFTGKPARSCVAVKELPKGLPVEIECIALPAKGSMGMM
jgi:2-iminobutanoate/2-iminopropanoate deaminase